MRITGMTLAVGLLLAGMAQAQEEPATDLTKAGSFDVGGRATGVEGDAARFQRYRDLRDGAYLDRFRFTRDSDVWLFDARALNIGYRDQQYVAEYERFGRVKASFVWDQIPLFLSADTRLPFTQEAPGVLRIPDSFQAGVQNRILTRFDLNALAVSFDTRSRRDTATAGLVYTIRPDLDLKLRVTNTNRDGRQNWAAPFGFNNAIELAAPVDQRTTDVAAHVEWANERGMIRAGYDGSWFDNAVSTLVWDNPIRITDITTPNAYVTGDAASQGRMDLWPNSTAHTASAMATVNLPRRSRAYGHFSGGLWSQNDPLLPHTINTAIPPIPLERSTAEAEAQITAATLGLVSRPTNMLWLNARFRYYDYDNQTPHIAIPEIVRFDGVTGVTATGGPHPFSLSRNFLDLDASFTPSRFVALRAGYGREHDERTFRMFETTTEHTLRASVDSTGLTQLTVRGIYEYSNRTGEGLDEEVLDDIGEQVSLRQFDISDRKRHRVSTVVQVTPVEMLALSATAGVGRDNRPDAAFGLQDNDHTFWTAGMDVVPNERVSLGVQYGREDYDTLQRSRQANPGAEFNDPRRDWTTDYDETVHNVTAGLDLLEVVSKTNLRLAYDWNRSRGRYVYGLAPNSTLTPPVQLPELLHELGTFSADIEYRLTRRVALRLAYLYEDFNVDDFAFAPTILSLDSIVQPVAPASPTTTFLRYLYRPYTANTGWIGIRYFW